MIRDVEPKTDRSLVTIGAALGGLAVVLGAIGAHALRSRISADAIGWWQTAVQFQMWHALAVLGLGLGGSRFGRLSPYLLAIGAILFSASLYALALGAPRFVGAITPFGGLLMIAGWLVLVWRAARSQG